MHEYAQVMPHKQMDKCNRRSHKEFRLKYFSKITALVLNKNRLIQLKYKRFFHNFMFLRLVRDIQI